MDSLAKLLTDYYQERGSPSGVGAHMTSVAGVKFIWAAETSAKELLLYEPGLIILGQGSKRVRLGLEVFEYDPEHYLSVTVPVPMECEVIASATNPLLGMFVCIDRPLLAELVGLVTPNGLDTAQASKTPDLGVQRAALDASMRDTAVRLAQTMSSDLDGRALGQSLKRELFFRALQGPHGGSLRAMTRDSGNAARIAEAVNLINARYAERLLVDDLAKSVGMSNRSFHRSFVAVISDTPLQYIKKVRLTKARHLIVNERIPASVAAAAVGYESASQFSREFKRYFLTTPSDAREGTEPPLEF